MLFFKLRNCSASAECGLSADMRSGLNEKGNVWDLLNSSDFITVHIPASDKYIIDSNEFSQMRNGVGILNLSRGGILNEEELLKNIESGKVSFAGIDTFENEPKPSIKILMNSNISLTPHIGAATNEAQDRIGVELADKINEILGWWKN